MIIIFFICLILPFQSLISLDVSLAQYPVDVSFLVADLKYSKEQGVKICEVQQGILSTFDGDIFCRGGDGSVAKGFVDSMVNLQKNTWAVKGHIAEYHLQVLAKKMPSWILKRNLFEITSDLIFNKCAAQPVKDFSRISDYHGFIYLRISSKSDRKRLIQKYPGIILIDRVTYPFWGDKHRMSLLFKKEPFLTEVKPRWNLYHKKYNMKLADTIMNDLQCDRFVIKPKGEFLGRGVIIVDKENLDDTLKCIMKKNRKLKKHPDPSRQYWYNNHDDSFIVEQFIESDPLKVPHLDDDFFNPTMRVAYLLKYDKQEIDVSFLGANWFLPSHPIDQEGTLNQKHKGYNEIPYYTLVDEGLLIEVRKQLDEAMRRLYWQMLIYTDSDF
jgi:hypothetical protein